MQRLTDAEILAIFMQIDTRRDGDDFVKAFAHAVVRAPRRDFMVMRSVILLMIGKYNLGGYLSQDPICHEKTPTAEGGNACLS